MKPLCWKISQKSLGIWRAKRAWFFTSNLTTYLRPFWKGKTNAVHPKLVLAFSFMVLFLEMRHFCFFSNTVQKGEPSFLHKRPVILWNSASYPSKKNWPRFELSQEPWIRENSIPLHIGYIWRYVICTHTYLVLPIHGISPLFNSLGPAAGRL